MASFLVIGSASSCDSFLEELIDQEKIAHYNVTTFDQTVKIDEARKIRVELFSQQVSKRVIVVKNGMTIEAQNSLLKILEETGDASFFVFYAQSEEEYLQTIRSRCFIKKLDSPEIYEYSDFLKSIDSFTFNEIDELAEKCGKNIKSLLPSLRQLLLDERIPVADRKKYYIYCKRLMTLQKLSEVNNVNEKILLEKVFLV